MNRLPWWRDALGLVLALAGTAGYVIGVVITWNAAGPIPALLVVVGLAVASAGVLTGRYDPDVAAARRAERARRSVTGPVEPPAG